MTIIYKIEDPLWSTYLWLHENVKYLLNKIYFQAILITFTINHRYSPNKNVFIPSYYKRLKFDPYYTVLNKKIHVWFRSTLRKVSQIF